MKLKKYWPPILQYWPNLKISSIRHPMIEDKSLTIAVKKRHLSWGWGSLSTKHCSHCKTFPDWESSDSSGPEDSPIAQTTSTRVFQSRYFWLNQVAQVWNFFLYTFHKQFIILSFLCQPLWIFSLLGRKFKYRYSDMF